MSWTRPILATLRNDGLRLARDRFLLGTTLYVLAIAVAMRWLVPWLQAELLARHDVDISPWVGLGMSYFVVINTSVLTGVIGGMLLVEAREERTVEALLVTPTPMWLPLATLSAVITAIGAAMTMALSVLIGVGTPGSSATLAAAVIGAPTGVVIAMLVATVASNKVEAFAIMKVASFLGLLPVAGYFLPEPAQYIVGLVPPYWACKLWWMGVAGETGWAWLIAPGAVVSALWIGILVHRFRAVVQR
ncbi:hypothetical protein [Haliangium sp.]|uniref:hypothetical protein n=1 Tax=Haliangium sp. TaxID=2663208 RepID=UPI003D0C1255